MCLQATGGHPGGKTSICCGKFGGFVHTFAVGAAGLTVGGAGFRGVVPNELRAIAGFLGEILRHWLEGVNLAIVLYKAAAITEKYPILAPRYKKGHFHVQFTAESSLSAAPRNPIPPTTNTCRAQMEPDTAEKHHRCVKSTTNPPASARRAQINSRYILTSGRQALDLTPPPQRE